MSTILLRRVFTLKQPCTHHEARCANRFRLLSSHAGRSHTPPPRSQTLRRLGIFSLATTLSLTTFTLGSIFPPAPLSFIFPRAAPGPPSDPTTPESIAWTQSIETSLQSLSEVAAHRNRPDADQWYETRPYEDFPEDRRVNNLTAGALRGPGKLAVPPILRVRRDESEVVAFVNLGRGLCGHDGIVHGGLLATLLDETLARVAINNLPERVGVTANLSLQYRAPTRADQVVVLKASLVKVEGRKASVTGHIEDLQGNILVEATALFVQPRYAKVLKGANGDAMRKAMGEPPSSEAPLRIAAGDKIRP